MRCLHLMRTAVIPLVCCAVPLLPTNASAHGLPARTISATPAAISPDGDGRADAAHVSVRLARSSFVATSVRRGGRVVRHLPNARVRAGLRSFRWDGRTDTGVPAQPGAYVLRIALRDPSGHRRVVNARLRVVSTAVPVTSVPAATLQWPISGSVSSLFGPRGGRMHQGIDIPAPSMTPIAAAAAGIVRQAGHVTGYGLTITLDHPDGTATLYAHQAKLGATVGAAVAAGQVIGYVGSTGSSTTDHLHFELHDASGKAVDPLPHLPPR